jgi:hypothetical protein
LAGGATLTHHLTQNVPAWTSAGVYWNRAFLGANVYNVLSADSFQFTKSETYDSENFPIENWILSGWEDNLIPENPYPLSFILYPCQPNPFNSKTSLKFSLPEGGEVKIEIFDITGRLITTLTEGDYPVGNYNITWDAFEFASGIYFARLQVGKFTQTQKLLLMK